MSSTSETTANETDGPSDDDGEAESSSEETTTGGMSTMPATTNEATSSASTSPTSGESSSSGGDDTMVDPPMPGGLCGMMPPAGSQQPPPLPAYSGGACPALVPGLNTLPSGGADRTFILVVPEDAEPSEQLPVMFLWHWLGGSADSFLEKGEVQDAANQLRFIAVIPEEKGDLLFRWPFTPLDSADRIEEEFVFFDDALACVADAYPIEPNCVASAGVSAGALFTGQLAQGRGDRLSSMVSLSGGVGAGLINPWNGSPHKMPAFVLWGGPEDDCLDTLHFDTASAELMTGLQADGHAILECEHNCGHAEPPFEPGEGITKFAAMWQFVLDHPYWLEDGESPWNTEGVPSFAPQWCAMGVGSSTPRTGECAEPSQC